MGQDTSSHGSYAQQRKGHCPPLPPLQEVCPILGQAERLRLREGDLRHGQEGIHSIPDRCGPQGFPRYPPGQDGRWQQDRAYLRSQGLAPSLPEDLYCLIKKAVSVRKHLEKNRKDKDSKFRLILIESRIHRLARYYKLAKRIPGNWRYESSNAAALLV